MLFVEQNANISKKWLFIEKHFHMSLKRVNVFTSTSGSQPLRPTAVDAANIVYDIERNALEAITKEGSAIIFSPETTVSKSSSIPTGSTDSIGDNGSVAFSGSTFYWKTGGRWLRLTGMTFNSVATLTTKEIVDNNNLTATSGGIITDDGGFEITEKGLVWGTTSSPTLSDSVVSVETGTTDFVGVMTDLTPFDPVYVRAYATNSIGTGYGNERSFEPNICLAVGTKISLWDGSYKNIEDITYEDNLKVWNFDEGRFDSSRPLWIKKPEFASSYNILKFSDGSELRTINQHRVFSIDKGKFIYPMSDDCPVGMETFGENGDRVSLLSKEVINEGIEYFNVITDYHINLFSDGILTSCRYNNIYPIEDMCFVKDGRVKRAIGEFSVPESYYHGLRLSEQFFPVLEAESYIRRLERKKKDI